MYILSQTEIACGMSDQESDFINRINHDAETNCLQLPSLPEVVVRVNEAIDNDGIGVREVARLIQLDPALAARLLKIANSPLYRQNLQLSDLNHAVQRLGLTATRNIITSLVMQNLFDVRSVRLHYKIRDLWQHSCRVAAISQVLAALVPGLQPDRAMLAGLLHDIGILPVLVYADRYDPIGSDAARLDELIEQLRIPLGEKVLAHWSLGTDLAVVPSAAEHWYRESGDTLDYGDVVMVAQIHSFLGQNDGRELPLLSEVPAFNKMSIARMGPYAGIEMLEQARGQINATIRMLNG